MLLKVTLMLLWGDKLRSKGVLGDKQRVHFASLHYQFFRGKQLHLEKELQKLHSFFPGITLPLSSTEVSTAGVTRSWRLEFLQHFLTERLELVWALEVIRSKHTSYSPFISDPKAGGTGKRLPHAPSFHLAWTGSTPIDHWHTGASALRTQSESRETFNL